MQITHQQLASRFLDLIEETFCGRCKSKATFRKKWCIKCFSKPSFKELSIRSADMVKEIAREYRQAKATAKD